MTRYPHRIRLRGPWECEPEGRPPLRLTLPGGGPTDLRGRARFRRRFGHPGRIDDFERVWLTVAGLSDRAEASLNGVALGECTGGPCEFEVTRLVRERNELVIDVDATGRGVWDEVALEVRCRAYLRDVRVWAEAEVHATGLVVGQSDRPLDLYLLLDNRTTAYGTAAAAPEGAAFHIIGGKPPAGRVRARVDLVNGAVVWWTAEQDVEFGA